MKLSYDWLGDFVTIPWKPEELAERLTMAGIEVEGMVRQGAGLESVVVGRIVTSKPHPNADRLSICEVESGGARHQIVCGAKNHKAGDHVPLALPGTRLPNGLEIKAAKLRGVASEGMLCSGRELGLSEDGEGLLILAPDTKVGTRLTEVLGLDDTVIDVEITPNRPDLLSHLGVAREIATLAGVPLRAPKLFEGKPSGKETFAVEIRDPELCMRYSARLIRGVKVGPSPEWLRKRLAAVGQRSINNMVDLTNYVMLDVGQPLHAFDTRCLDGGKIIVRRAASGEKIKTLDGTDLVLDSDVLVIADGRKPVALAGVMGGVHSGVQADTTELLIESATFAPSNIRRTAKKYQIRSESSYRFERGVDPRLAALGSDLCTRLVCELAGGQAAGPLHMVEPAAVQKRTVSVRGTAISRMAGQPLPEKEIEKIFHGLGFVICKRSTDQAGEHSLGSWSLEVPSYRLDINEEVDLLEEIVRIYGIENLPSKPPHARWIRLEEPGAWFEHGQVRDLVRGLGFDEVQNYTLVSAGQAHRIHGEAFSKDQLLANPLNSEMDALRADLFMGIIDAVARNHAKRNLSLELFEIGRVFEGQHESTHLGLVLGGPVPLAGWEGTGRAYDFFDLKGRLQRVIETVAGAGEIRWEHASHKAFSLFIAIYRGKEEVGFLGEVSRSLLKSKKIEGQVCFAELDLDLVLTCGGGPAKLRPLPLYPAIQRDLAIVVEKSLPFDDVRRTLLEIAVAEARPQKIVLEALSLFDIFESSQVGAGKKSMAFRFVYRSLEKTLTDNEVNELHSVITEQATKRLRCEVRT